MVLAVHVTVLGYDIKCLSDCRLQQQLQARVVTILHGLTERPRLPASPWAAAAPGPRVHAAPSPLGLSVL